MGTRPEVPPVAESKNKKTASKIDTVKVLKWVVGLTLIPILKRF